MSNINLQEKEKNFVNEKIQEIIVLLSMDETMDIDELQKILNLTSEQKGSESLKKVLIGVLSCLDTVTEIETIMLLEHLRLNAYGIKEDIMEKVTEVLNEIFVVLKKNLR